MLGSMRVRYAALLLITLGLVAACSSSREQPVTEQETAANQVFFTLADGGSPTCPEVATLVQSGPSDEPALLSVAPAMVDQLYDQPGHETYTNLKATPAAQAGLHGEMVTKWCGPQVAASSWVVGLTFPQMAPSASMSGGIFMVSKTQRGWQVWYRYR